MYLPLHHQLARLHSNGMPVSHTGQRFLSLNQTLLTDDFRDLKPSIYSDRGLDGTRLTSPYRSTTNRYTA
jgi:hypothetical protein